MPARMAPRNVESAMPILAAATAATRLRLAPWNEAKPAGSAPSAAKAPCSMWPLIQPRVSGVSTPAAARAARHGATAPQWKGPSWTSRLHRNPRRNLTSSPPRELTPGRWRRSDVARSRRHPPRHVRPDHLRRVDDAIELFRRDVSQLQRGLPERQVVVQRVVGNLRCLVVADDRRQCGGEHQRPLDVLVDLLHVQLRALDQELAEVGATIREDRDGLDDGERSSAVRRRSADTCLSAIDSFAGLSYRGEFR